MNIKLAGGISCTESAFRDPLKLSGMLCGWITPARNVNNTQATAQTKYGNIVTSGIRLHIWNRLELLSQEPKIEAVKFESRTSLNARRILH